MYLIEDIGDVYKEKQEEKQSSINPLVLHPVLINSTESNSRITFQQSKLAVPKPLAFKFDIRACNQSLFYFEQAKVLSVAYVKRAAK